MRNCRPCARKPPPSSPPLVQTAHDNPDLIKTLAGNGELSAVLKSSSGKADPVGAVQALANIGKAALADSAGLMALLKGKGVADLLNSLPAGTNVKDVAAAVSNGGLSAGAVAVKPPADGNNAPVKLPTLDASGGLVGNGEWIGVGVQATAIQGVLGAGNDASTLTVNDKGTYALGTAGGDTLSGNYVWSFGGGDTITATGSATYNSAVIAGGEGADTIHAETSSSKLMYQGSTDSFLAADDAVAHGFDTVYLSNGASTAFTETFSFAGLKFGDLYNVTSASGFTGTESGNALTATLNAAVGTSFKTGGDVQLALVNFGKDSNGHAVHFLAIDANKNGHVDSADIVIEIVGSIDSGSFYNQSGDGYLSLQTQNLA